MTIAQRRPGPRHPPFFPPRPSDDDREVERIRVVAKLDDRDISTGRQAFVVPEEPRFTPLRRLNAGDTITADDLPDGAAQLAYLARMGLIERR